VLQYLLLLLLLLLVLGCVIARCGLFQQSSVVCLCVCVSVCLLVTFVSPAETAELLRCHLGGLLRWAKGTTC